MAATLLAGCGDDGESTQFRLSAADDSTTTTILAPTTTTTTEPPTTTTTVSYATPTLTITCPQGRAAYVGKPEKWGFGYQFQWWAPSATLWIDYGDGKAYTAKTEAQMKAAMTHVYDRPGSYVVNATLTDSVGQSMKSACQWTWTDTLAEAMEVLQDVMTGNGSVGGGGLVGGGSSLGRSNSVAGCYHEGQKLWGSVKVVDYGADITVKVVSYGADLNVKKVDYGASSCGLWNPSSAAGEHTVGRK